jgi:hypothetical protein
MFSEKKKGEWTTCVLELCLVRRRRRVAARIGEGLGGVRGRWREVSHFSLSLFRRRRTRSIFGGAKPCRFDNKKCTQTV